MNLKKHKPLKLVEKNSLPLVLKTRTKIWNMIWDFHKGDDDMNPSVPHGHSIDGKYKIELWSGTVYDRRTKKVIGKALRKEIEDLYNNPSFLFFVKEVRESYLQRHPHIRQLPELVDAPVSKKYMKLVVGIKNVESFRIKVKVVILNNNHN